MWSHAANSSLTLIFMCTSFKTSLLVFSSFTVSYVLFLPLFVSIVYLAVQQRRKRRLSSMNHSDFFTCNVVGLELISILGYCLYCVGVHSGGRTLQLMGMCVCSITSPAQVLFHLLTCVERYLAVVHPVSYLRLRQARGLRLRNAGAACVWLLCAALMAPNLFNSGFLAVATCCVLVFSLVLVSFCSFSVLCVLTQSGPGQLGRDRKQDHTKQRAFVTIAAIMVAQWFKLAASLVSTVVFGSSVSTLADCVVGISVMWLTLPCSLVLPLLFLHRAGKLPGCRAG